MIVVSSRDGDGDVWLPRAPLVTFSLRGKEPRQSITSPAVATLKWLAFCASSQSNTLKFRLYALAPLLA